MPGTLRLSRLHTVAHPALFLSHLMSPLLALKCVANLSCSGAKRAPVLHALVLLLGDAAGRHLMVSIGCNASVAREEMLPKRLLFPDWLADMTSAPALTEHSPFTLCLLCQVYLWVRVCGRSGAPGGHSYD